MVVLVLGYGVGYFHREQLSKSDLDRFSRSLMLADASRDLFLLKSLKDKDGEAAKTALTTFLSGHLAILQSSWEADTASSFNEKVCSLIGEMEKSGISLERDKGETKPTASGPKTLAELRAACENRDGQRAK